MIVSLQLKDLNSTIEGIVSAELGGPTSAKGRATSSGIFPDKAKPSVKKLHA